MTKDEALEYFGTQQAMARAIGRSQPYISQRLHDPMPEKIQLAVLSASQGDLLPDARVRSALLHYARLHRLVRRKMAPKRTRRGV